MQWWGNELINIENLQSLTFIVVNKDVLMARIVFVVVTITDGDGEGVGPAGWWTTAIFHDDREVVVFLTLTVKRSLRRDDTRALAIQPTTYTKNTKYGFINTHRLM